MAIHRLRNSSDGEFQVHCGDNGVITAIEGRWPAESDYEFELTGEMPRFAAAPNVPAHLAASAQGKGLQICYYDPVHCRTCYCDGKGKVIRCIGHC